MFENQDEDIDSMYRRCVESVRQAEAILKLKPIKGCRYSGNVWWTESCQRSIQQKKSMFKMHVKNKSRENEVLVKQAKK